MPAVDTRNPRQAVLAAYDAFLRLCASLGEPRAERLTPHEHLEPLPLALRSARRADRRLVELYTLAAYAPMAIAALAAIDRDVGARVG